MKLFRATRQGAFHALLLLLVAANVDAQPGPSTRAVLRVDVDNDFLALRGKGAPPDYDYTHGTRIAVYGPAIPSWLGKVGRASSCTVTNKADAACVTSGFGVGQMIYTPRHNEAQPVRGDRPYAAWLYASIQAERASSVASQLLSLRIGTTGPGAFGEQLQNSVHRMLGNHLERGWSYQIPARAAFALEYIGARVVANGIDSRPSRLVGMDVGGTLGNFRQSLKAGVFAHYGFGRAYGRTADAPLLARPARFHVAAAITQSVVLRDYFIEGIGDISGAERTRLVNEAHIGLGGRFRKFSVEYRYVSRSREYAAQPGRHAYGSFRLAITAN